jgi:hypothetical protein
MIYSYFKPNDKNSNVFVHVKMAENLEINYYMSFITFEEKEREGILNKWKGDVQFSKKITSKKRQTKVKMNIIKRCGKVKLHQEFIGNIFGEKFLEYIPETIRANICINVNSKKKFVEVCIIAKKDTKFLVKNLANHDSFSHDPDKETINANLKPFTMEFIK